MLTALLIGFPLLAALLVFCVKGNASRNLALGFSIIEFALSLVAFCIYKQGFYHSTSPGYNRSAFTSRLESTASALCLFFSPPFWFHLLFCLLTKTNMLTQARFTV
jgi:hypothetical protein